MRTLFGIVLLTFVVTAAKLSDGVDYNKLVKWVKHRLVCTADKCRLSVNGGPEQSTKCTRTSNSELSEDPIVECDIGCEGADRDSVIQKFPPNNHKCIRFYSYNTLRKSNGWSIWRSGICAEQKITFEVHCGFPE